MGGRGKPEEGGEKKGKKEEGTQPVAPWIGKPFLFSYCPWLGTGGRRKKKRGEKKKGR